MNGLKSIVMETLASANVLLSDREQQRLRQETYVSGKRLLWDNDSVGPNDLSAAVRSFGWVDQALPRLLGFGLGQTDGLAALAVTPVSMRPEVGLLGALFNLGIVLFDYICDHFPDRAKLLFSQVTPEFMEAQLTGSGGRFSPSGDASIDFLLKLIVDIFSRSRALTSDSLEDRRTIMQLIGSMYEGQRFSIESRRDRVPPTMRVLRELRRKSALPMAFMAQIALIPCLYEDHDTRDDVVRRAARLAGDAMWIADDLADIAEDWDAGCWSRPLWIFSRSGGPVPENADQALYGIIETGIAQAEAHRLAKRLMSLRELTGAHSEGFARSIRATIHAWLEILPG